MALENQTVSYQIELTQVGNGAAVAEAQLKGVADSAAQTRAALDKMNEGVARINASLDRTVVATRSMTTTQSGARAGMRALSGTVVLLGGTQFPQLTTAIIGAQHAMEALKETTTITTVGLTRIGILIAALYATYKFSLHEYKNALEATNKLAEDQGVGAGISAMQKTIRQLGESGDLSAKQIHELLEALQGVTEIKGLNAVRGTLQGILGGRADITEQADAVLKILEAQQRITETAFPGKVQGRTAIELAPGVPFTTTVGETLDLKIDELRRRQAEFQKQTGYSNEQLAGQREYLDLEVQIQQATAEKVEYEKRYSDSLKNNQELTRLLAAGTTEFVSSFSHTLVDGFRRGRFEFQKFAADFLSQIAEMILQAALLRALFAGFTGLGGSAASFNSTMHTNFKAAQGAIIPNHFAMGGVATVSSPTFLPKFNAEVGEAGPEWLTVLSRPKMMQIGGIQAAVGNVGQHKLALTHAADLARAGGHVSVDINLSPGLEASIVQNSIKGAEIRINNSLRNYTDTSRAVKALA